MEQRLDFYKANPNAIKALLALEDQIGKSSLEKSLAELVRLRASQINGFDRCWIWQSPSLRASCRKRHGLRDLHA